MDRNQKIAIKLKQLSNELHNKSKVYFLEDLKKELTSNIKMVNSLTDAGNLWRQRVEEYYKQHGDKCGSCVSNAGIVVWVLESLRHKYPTTRFILRAPDHYQGSLSWEESINEIINKIKTETDLDCWYDCGYMI